MTASDRAAGADQSAPVSPPPSLPPPPHPPPPASTISGPGWGATGLAAGEPQRLHPSSPVLDLIASARQWVLPLAIITFGSARSLVTGPLFLIGLAAVVGWKVLAWRRFSYRLDHDVLVIERGILQRHRREVPVNRIQQVDLQRRLRHRVVGVAVVRIDTAGGGRGAEVVLEAIGDDASHTLRSALLVRSGVGAPNDDGSPEVDLADEPLGPSGPGTGPAAASSTAIGPSHRAEPVLELDTRALIVAGVTGSRLLAVLPLAGAAFGFFGQLPEGLQGNLADHAPTGAAVAVVAAVAVLPLLAVFAAATSVLTDHGFTLVRVGDDLHLRRGLLDQREATISLRRIQAVNLHENVVRRRLGLASVQLQSAGSGSQAEGDVTRVTIPLVRRADLDALLARILPAAVDAPPLIPPPSAARRRAWVRGVLPATVVLPVMVAAIAVLSDWRQAVPPLAVICVVLLAVLAATAELRFRNLGHAATPELVVASGGGWVRHLAFVPVAKTQSTLLRSSPFQRRSGLATLRIDVAGRHFTPTITDGDADRLAALRTAALHARPALADEELVRRRTRTRTASVATRPPEPDV